MAVACEICADAGVRIAVDKLLRDKRSVRDIAGMVGRSKSCVGRHRRHTELPEDAKRPATTRSRGAGQLASQPGRCEKCGGSFDAIDTDALLRRAERFLWMAETIATQAIDDKDGRLLMQAIDRGNKSLDLLMRAKGIIGGSDGVSVTVAVDARKLEADVSSWSVPARRIAAAELTEQEALEAVDWVLARRCAAVQTIEHDALPPG